MCICFFSCHTLYSIKWVLFKRNIISFKMTGKDIKQQLSSREELWSDSKCESLEDLSEVAWCRSKEEEEQDQSWMMSKFGKQQKKIVDAILEISSKFDKKIKELDFELRHKDLIIRGKDLELRRLVSEKDMLVRDTGLQMRQKDETIQSLVSIINSGGDVKHVDTSI